MFNILELVMQLSKQIFNPFNFFIFFVLVRL